MSLKQEAFRAYNEEKKDDTFTVKLNPEERIEFDIWKKIIEQPKDSTALKQLASIGAKVLQQHSMSLILETIFKNKRKNKRSGESIRYE